MKLRAVLISAFVLVTAGLAACGDDDTVSELTFGVEEADGSYAFTGVPDEVDGGRVEITLDNREGEEPHELQLIKVDEGTTYDEFAEFTEEEGAPLPDFIGDTGGGVGRIAPGDTLTTVQELPEGTYLYFCEVDAEGAEGEEGEEGAEEGEEGEEDTKTHAELGMNGSFTVEGDDAEADTPETSGSITATEYEFETDGLTSGSQTITFENAGDEYHHLVAAPIADGKSLADVTAFFESEGEPEGPPPIDFETAANTAVLAPGQTIFTDIEFGSGTYAFFCFISDRAGGPPHVAKGMLTEVEIS